MRNLIYFLLVVGCTRNAEATEPLLGGPCDGCETLFDGKPARLVSSARIAPVGEPGEPMTIDGVVRDRAGKPAAGIVVYAYHTNAKGLYPGRSDSHRHGTMRGWVVTDRAGHYHFDTNRPAPYPERKVPQHVHMQLVEPGRCYYTIENIQFTDDPLLVDKTDGGRGGSGIVTPTRDDSGWHVTRDITLGANIPNYERCR